MCSSLYEGKSGFPQTLLPFISGSLTPLMLTVVRHMHAYTVHRQGLLWFLIALVSAVAWSGYCSNYVPSKACASVWAASVCRSVMIDPQLVVEIALFQMLLLALISTGLILSPVPSLTPVLHYYLLPMQDYVVTSCYRGDSPAFIPRLFIVSATAAYILLLSQCVKDSGEIFPRAWRHTFIVYWKTYISAQLADTPLADEDFKGTYPTALLEIHISVI